MEWIKIDKDNLPEGQVLCANFDVKSLDYGKKIIGKVEFLHFSDESILVCNSDNEFDYVSDVTHYLDIDKFDL